MNKAWIITIIVLAAAIIAGGVVLGLRLPGISAGAEIEISSPPQETSTNVVRDDTGDKTAQKIDINRADPWLLDALPGIGEELAKRIVAYRKSNGFFQSTEELLKVKGISASVYDKIKDLITVSE